MKPETLDAILGDEKKARREALAVYKRVLTAVDPTPTDIEAFRQAKHMLGKSEEAVKRDLRALDTFNDLQKRIAHARSKEVADRLNAVTIQIHEHNEETSAMLRERNKGVAPMINEKTALENLAIGAHEWTQAAKVLGGEHPELLG